jgi:hypothetical protein
MVHEVSPGPMGLDPFLIFQKILSNVPDMAPEPNMITQYCVTMSTSITGGAS